MRERAASTLRRQRCWSRNSLRLLAIDSGVFWQGHPMWLLLSRCSPGSPRHHVGRTIGAPTATAVSRETFYQRPDGRSTTQRVVVSSGPALLSLEKYPRRGGAVKGRGGGGAGCESVLPMCSLAYQKRGPWQEAWGRGHGPLHPVLDYAVSSKSFTCALM